MIRKSLVHVELYIDIVKLIILVILHYRIFVVLPLGSTTGAYTQVTVCRMHLVMK